jgi:methionine-rich copper-binding protein CopC
MAGRWRSGACVALLTAATVVAAARGAAPHATLVKSAPAARAVLAEAPARVELLFSERIEAAYAELSVWNGSGARVDRQDALVGPDDGRRLSVGLLTLRPGVYTVRYRVLSIDGHVITSTFPFTVSAPRVRW